MSENEAYCINIRVAFFRVKNHLNLNIYNNDNMERNIQEIIIFFLI